MSKLIPKPDWPNRSWKNAPFTFEWKSRGTADNRTARRARLAGKNPFTRARRSKGTENWRRDAWTFGMQAQRRTQRRRTSSYVDPKGGPWSTKRLPLPGFPKSEGLLSRLRKKLLG